MPQSTAEGRLKKVFSQFGEVKQVHVVRERVSRQSLGSAFVWFDNEESVQLAVNELNGKFFDGRFVSVKIAVPGLSKKRGRTTQYKF
ncbi:hypothetical protein Goarm_012437 [Gossypium armourianum]|uniref:RRM domain-containing protein n=1 Tax=Gossypium armourianum TaxID=34283 RepID=A0A7J9IZW8_9ROSI|nr:hypothetical protein [Gossypium armourianum]